MRSKVLAVIIIVTAFVSILIALMFYRRASGMIEENYQRTLYARLRQMGDSFDNSMKEIYQLAVQESSDEALTGLVEKSTGPDSEQTLDEISELLKIYANRSPDIDSVYLVMSVQEIIVTSEEYPIYKKTVSAERLNEIYFAGQTPLTPVFLRNPLNEEDRMLSYISPIEDEDGKTVAYIMNNMTETAFYYKYLDTLDGGADRAAILDRNRKIILGTDPEPAKSAKMITAEYKAGFSGFCFYAKADRSEVLTDLRYLRVFVVLILLAAFGVVAASSVVITGAMYRPLENLTDAMEAVSEGELEERVQVTTKDEIGTLSGEFNQMLDHIQDLVHKLVQEETLKKNAELEALQYQITPHFMYNTLNSIKYAALLKGDQEIGGLIGEFIELLQASVSRKGTFVTVAEEMHFVRNYMGLQSMRYEEKIAVEYHVQEESAGCFVPRLILQPLVENAILYGLDLKNGRNRIVIGSEVNGEILSLWVLDNGRKLEREQIQSLMSTDRKKTGGLSGIGVANVRERLKLYYGAHGGITYESSENGTKACIRLPAYRDRDKYEL